MTPLSADNLTNSWTGKLSVRARNAAPVPDIYINNPKLIDFSLGSPAKETFPVEELAEAAYLSLKSPKALQYCPDRGSSELITSLVSWLAQYAAVSASSENVIITNGAQDAVALVADTLIDPSDVVLTEAPTYWRAKSILRNIGAEIDYVPLQQDGVDVRALEARLRELRRSGKHVKLFYTIPTHQNPTGVVTSLETRRRVLALSDEYDLVILEDDAYLGFTYSGPVPVPLYSLSGSERVIYIGTLSNLISPGLRIGWLVASQEFANHVLKLKRDSGTNPIVSRIAIEMLNTLPWSSRFSFLQSFYNARLETLACALSRIPGGWISWRKPRGGHHIWVRLNREIQLSIFLKECQELNVAVMPGTLCIGDSEISKHHVRLSFSSLSVEGILEGVNRLHTALSRCIGIDRGAGRSQRNT